MKKYFILFSFVAVALMLVSAGYAAKTIIGYVNGEKLLMGVSYNNKTGSLMLTTQNTNCDWDNLLETYNSYTETWQTHSAGFPPDWRVGGGSASVYNVVTGTDNVLQAIGITDAFGRIIYSPGGTDPTWAAPADFTITAKNIQLQYESNVTVPGSQSIIRIGFAGAAGTNDFGIPIQVSSSGLYAYQFFCSTMMLDQAEQVWGVPRQIAIRDGQAIPLQSISYSGFTSGATLTFRLVVRDPIQVEFCDTNKDSLTTIPSTGAYVKVEALDLFSYNSALRDTTSVTVWTSGGDSETVGLTELFDAQTTTNTFYNCNNNVFINDTPLSVSTSLSVTPAFIRLNPGQSTTFVATGNPIQTNNNRIDGFGIVTTYVAYNGTTASAPVTCGGTAPFTWTSSDTTIANIDSGTGALTATGIGTITVTATDANGFTGTATVQILSTNAPIIPETSTIYIRRNKLIDTKF
jgi:hypothetical protein